MSQGGGEEDISPTIEVPPLEFRRRKTKISMSNLKTKSSGNTNKISRNLPYPSIDLD